MADECCASNGNVMILSCSGAFNVGQLANRAAVAQVNFLREIPSLAMVIGYIF